MATRREARGMGGATPVSARSEPHRQFGSGVRNILDGQTGDTRARQFTETIVRGVHEHVTEIDKTLKSVAENWDIKRMGVLDRNVIRMACTKCCT